MIECGNGRDFTESVDLEETFSAKKLFKLFLIHREKTLFILTLQTRVTYLGFRKEGHYL